MSVLRYTSTGPLLTLTKPLSVFPERTALRLHYYKKFYRLRNLVADNSYDQNRYCELLRRRFRSDFGLRRTVILGLGPLSEDNLQTRLANTYAFVFNATCNVTDAQLPVLYYEDLPKPRMETQILKTVLEIDKQTPSRIRYDRSYSWVHDTQSFYKELLETELTKKAIKNLGGAGKAEDLGFLDYEKTIMSLNETVGLCL